MSNRLVTAIKQMGNNYEPNGNNVVVIDTLNNRLGINTSSPDYSIDISENSNIENSNIIKIANLLIDGKKCKISRIDNVEEYISINKLLSHDISCVTLNQDAIVFTDNSLVINRDLSINTSLTVPNLNSIIIDTSNLSTSGITTDGAQANYVILNSDDRLKHNEQPIVNALDIVKQLQPQIYQKTKTFLPANYIGKLEQPYIVEAGLIAQDVENIPELNFSVIKGDADKPYSLNYNNIFIYSLASIKELDQKIDNNRYNQDICINNIDKQITNNNISFNNRLDILNNKLDNDLDNKLNILDNSVKDISKNLSNFIELEDKILRINNIDNIDNYLRAINVHSQQIQRLTSQLEILTARIMSLENIKNKS